MPTYTFNATLHFGDYGEREFECEAKYAYYPAHNGRGLEPNEDASVSILSIWGQALAYDRETKRHVKTGPAINFFDLMPDETLADEILAYHEQGRADAREDAADRAYDAWRDRQMEDQA